MVDQKVINYKRIERAIFFINENFQDQPSLEEIAKSVRMSPYHFQRVFSEWAGVSPKKFMQYISLSYAKNLLMEPKSLLDVAHETGLSGPSRLHDLFVNIEGMTPGEFKKGGGNLRINFSTSDSPFGKIIIASTGKGICHLFFYENKAKAISSLKAKFPNAHYQNKSDHFQQSALSIFDQDWRHLDNIKLHLAGTPFQLKVWESLLKIPFGQVSSYGDLASDIGSPNSSRAVGTAIGRNPIAYIIPCHRVIQSTGRIGGYMWGCTKKSAIIGWEASRKK